MSLSVKTVAALVSMLLMGGVRAGDSGDNLAVTGYTDTCDYRYNMKCGDQCINRAAKCHCGSSDTFKPSWTDQYCCIPSGGSCTRKPGRRGTDDGFCSEGRKLSMSTPCNNTNRSLQCHNSYQDSQYIFDKSHYTCPHTCVPWEDMCRGVSWCEGDHEVCGPDLRCLPKNYKVKKYELTSSLVHGHHYCLRDNKINNGIYDSIDRSDESEVKSDGSAEHIDISSFTPCNDSNYYYSPGVMCGRDCRWSDEWCRGRTETCDTRSGEIRTNDPRLCSQPRVWSNASCSLNYDDGRVKYYALRCRGNNMRCVTP